jgi:hypothetical protein
MLILVDQKIPKEAFKKLAEFGNVLGIQTNGITYEAISGHPDIFISILNNDLIVAPNLPEEFMNVLRENEISFHLGEQDVGQKYPESSIYNIVSTSRFIIHNLKFTDLAVKDLAMGLGQIHVEQAYTRCNLLALKNDQFITSDRGIEKQLKEVNLDVFYVDPTGILLPGFKNGFIGACVGILDDQFFLIGSLKHYSAGEALRVHLEELGYEIIELYDGPLFDGGSIFFL